MVLGLFSIHGFLIARVLRQFLQGEDGNATAMKLFRVLKNPILNSV